MVEKSAIDPSTQSGPGYFFKEEETGGFEDALNFGYTGLPIHEVMQHSEIEDSIEVFIRKRKLIGAPHSESNATFASAREPPLRAANLVRVEVDSVDLTGAELLQQYLHSNSSTASDIEYARTVEAATQLSKERSLVESLHERPRWIVDEQRFRQVQLHGAALVIRK
jgi:hypothetical protein